MSDENKFEEWFETNLKSLGFFEKETQRMVVVKPDLQSSFLAACSLKNKELAQLREENEKLKQRISEAEEFVYGLALPCGSVGSFVRTLYGGNGCNNFVAEIADVHIKTARSYLKKHEGNV